MIKPILTALLLSNLVACASGGEPSPAASDSDVATGSDCISQSTIRDYTVLDDANLIVSESPKRKFHMVLSRRAIGLRSTWRIAFSSPTGRICSKFDSVIVNDEFGPEKIRIQSIRRLTPEDEEELLIRFGMKEPEHEQPRQPEEVEGAEVEELDEVATGSR